jgi:hypothetical protein
VSATWYVQLTPTFLVCYESYLQLQCGKLHGEIFLLARIDRAVSGMVYDAGSQVPVCASIWSCPSEVVLGFSAASILTFCRNHHLLQVLLFVLCHVSGSKTLLGKFYLFFFTVEDPYLAFSEGILMWSCRTWPLKISEDCNAVLIVTWLMQLFGRPQWLTVKGRSETYVSKVGTAHFLVPILCISCCLCMCPGEWVIKLTQLFWRWDGMVLTFKTDSSLVADYCRSESSRLANSDWNCCYSHHHYISRYVTCNTNGSSLFVVQEYGFWKPNRGLYPILNAGT